MTVSVCCDIKAVAASAADGEAERMRAVVEKRTRLTGRVEKMLRRREDIFAIDGESKQ